MTFGIPGRISKHRQFDPDSGEHLPGRVRLGADSSLRKLMRAARRSIVPPERVRVIETARESAGKRAWVYLNSCPLKSQMIERQWRREAAE